VTSPLSNTADSKYSAGQIGESAILALTLNEICLPT
jgi:hypothetical protein